MERIFTCSNPPPPSLSLSLFLLFFFFCTGFTFTLLLLDYGKGIPSEKNSCIEKPKSLAELLENFTKLEMDCQNILPFSGIPKIHKNMGQGLNIIRKIMDKVNIHYHKNDDIIDSLVESVDGSLLELEFSCKKR